MSPTKALIVRLPQALAGLGLASASAALPYMILFYDPPNSSSNLILNSFLMAAFGVVLVGLPLGLLCVHLLDRSDLLTARALIASGFMVPTLLSAAVLGLAGPFGLLFLPGILIGGIVMALTFWFWVQKPANRDEA